MVALSELGADERSGALPRFVWITPNLCHDMHDCSPATGDHFLAGLVPGLLRALGPRGVLFLTWDEGSSDEGCCRLAAGGHVVTIVAGAGARPGARLDTPGRPLFHPAGHRGSPGAAPAARRGLRVHPVPGLLLRAR